MSEFLAVVSLASFAVVIVMVFRLGRATRPGTRRPRRVLIAAAATWIVATVASFAALPPSTAQTRVDGQPLMSVAGFPQSWSKPYTSTTCAEFTDEMTPSQRFAAAADMLTLVWIKIEVSQARPSEAVIGQYRDAVAGACAMDSAKITEVAWAVWIHDDRFAA